MDISHDHNYLHVSLTPSDQYVYFVGVLEFQ